MAPPSPPSSPPTTYFPLPAALPSAKPAEEVFDVVFPWAVKAGSDLAGRTLTGNDFVDMAIESPGVPQLKQIQFLKRNPGWLSARTFTADIFLCPRNGREGAITNLYRQLLMSRDAHVDPSGVFTVVFDGGANLGFYSLIPAKMGRKTYAFDIQPTRLRGLELMAKSNGVSDNIVMYDAGLSETVSSIKNSFGG